MKNRTDRQKKTEENRRRQKTEDRRQKTVDRRQICVFKEFIQFNKGYNNQGCGPGDNLGGEDGGEVQ